MFHVIIPARYHAKRFPGKLLQPLAGKPLLQYTYENACRSGASSVTIATDDARIAQTATAFGASVVLTDTAHSCGTERMQEAARLLGLADDAVLVNVQGDEPLMPSENIQQVAAALLQQPSADVATLAQPIHTQSMIFDPNCVKVVCNTAGYALYFSRAPIPWDRDHFTNDEHTPVDLSPYQHHLGIYAYTYASVQRYCAWPSTSLEQIERLEQLRVLAHGGTIYVAPAAVNIPKGVDNLTDLQHLEQLLCAGSKAT